MKHEDIRLADAYTAPDARFHAATLRTLNQLHAKDARHKAPVALRAALIAAAMLLTIAAIGLAAGTFQSIFTHMTHVWTGGATTDYAHMEETAAQNVFHQTLRFANGASAAVALDQAYYNGEQLALGWSLCPAEGFAWFYDRNDPQYADLHPENEEEYSPEGELIGTTTHSFDFNLGERFGAGIMEEFERRLQEDGWAGIAWYDFYFSDSVYLPGVPGVEYNFDGTVRETTQDAYLMHDSAVHWWQDAALRLYQEYGSLPDGARNLDALRVEIHAYCRPRWYCEDASGKYYGYGYDWSDPGEKLEIRVEIPRSENCEDQSYHADATFPNHTASIDIRTTPIYTKFTIENALSEEWLAIWSNPDNFPDGKYPLRFPEDVIYGYEFFAEAGSELVSLPEHYRSIETPLSWAGNFVLPDGATALHIRPIYYNSGAHPDEDIIITLY